MELNGKFILSIKKALMVFLSDANELEVNNSLIDYCRSAQEKFNAHTSSFSISELNAIVQALEYTLKSIPSSTSNRSLKKEIDSMSRCKYFLLKQIAQATKQES